MHYPYVLKYLLWFIIVLNVAYQRPAYQSSTWLTLSADLSVDGNPVYSRCAHNADLTGGANWLVVDLGEECYIHHVVLTNRGKDCPSCGE